MIRRAPLLLIIAFGCGGPVQPQPTFDPPDISDQPLKGLDETQRATFLHGDELFDLALRDGDGLGPLYTHAACGECHDGAARGPGLVQKFVVVTTDGGYTPSADQSRLKWGHTEHPLTTAGAMTPVLAPR